MYSRRIGSIYRGSWVSRIAVLTITLYQEHLSPRKVWCCAYRGLTGEDSCSQYAKLAIEASGFFAALPLIWTRLRACGRAHLTLSEQGNTKKRKGPRSSYAKGAKKDVTAEACCAGCNVLSWLKG